jgi:hypothetical protein
MIHAVTALGTLIEIELSGALPSSAFGTFSRREKAWNRSPLCGFAALR